MFNLEQAIKEWRSQMAAQGIQAAEVLEELESHLRDEMQKQTQSGATEERAYEIARASIGEARVLKLEFTKLKANSRRTRFLEGSSIVFAVCMLLINTWNLLAFEMSALERAAGFAAVSLICLYVGCLPYALRLVDPSAYCRLAKTVKLATCLLCAWPIYALLEALRVVHLEIGVVPSIVLWCLYGANAIAACALGMNGRGRPLGGGGGSVPPLQPKLHPIPPCPPFPPEFGVSLLPSKPVDPAVRQSFEAACHEANRLGHDFIGTEHVLLGLLQLAKGPFAAILARMHLDREAVRGEVERLVCPTSPHAGKATPPFTPRARKAVTLAAREAGTLNQPYVTPELVFLGLLLEGSGVAALVLRKLGIQIENAREEILREMHTRPTG